jgi:hypothetical protein
MFDWNHYSTLYPLFRFRVRDMAKAIRAEIPLDGVSRHVLDLGAGNGELAAATLSGTSLQADFVEPYNDGYLTREAFSVARAVYQVPAEHFLETLCKSTYCGAIASHFFYHVHRQAWRHVIDDTLAKLETGGRLCIVMASERSPAFTDPDFAFLDQARRVSRSGAYRSFGYRVFAGDIAHTLGEDGRTFRRITVPWVIDLPLVQNALRQNRGEQGTFVFRRMIAQLICFIHRVSPTEVERSFPRRLGALVDAKIDAGRLDMLDELISCEA